MNVLFLDIDGVLNSARSCLASRGYPLTLEPSHLEKFDWVAVALVRRICETTGAKIVLSSMWRLHLPHDQIGKALDLPIIDATPYLGVHRGHEIAAWLARQQPAPERYAIVDDDGDMLPEQMSCFVHTDGREGLTYANAVRLAELLGGSIYGAVPSRTAVTEAM
jgi:hypothetical protein